MPVNQLLIHSLQQMYAYYGNEFTVECPTGSGRMINLWQLTGSGGERGAGPDHEDVTAGEITPGSTPG